MKKTTKHNNLGKILIFKTLSSCHPNLTPHSKACEWYKFGVLPRGKASPCCEHLLRELGPRHPRERLTHVDYDGEEEREGNVLLS